MSQNFLKRIITSTILLLLLIFVIFSHQYLFLLSILILSLITCLEAKNLFLRLFIANQSKKTANIKKLDIKFIIYNVVTFFYIFFYIL